MRFTCLIVAAFAAVPAFAGERFKHSTREVVTTSEDRGQPFREAVASLRAGFAEMVARQPMRGVFFGHRGAGCAGATYSARFVERFRSHAAPRASHGCAGSTMSAPPPVRAAGCSGGMVTLIPSTAQPTAQAAVEVGRPHLFQRAMVHRQLRVALGRAYDSGTPAQKAAAKRALEDPAVYDAAVAKVTNELNRAAKGQNVVGAIGDGKILDAILSRLPQILAAIEAIIKLIDGLSLHLPPAWDWQRMPAGPWPLPRVVPAWSAC